MIIRLLFAAVVGCCLVWMLYIAAGCVATALLRCVQVCRDFWRFM